MTRANAAAAGTGPEGSEDARAPADVAPEPVAPAAPSVHPRRMLGRYELIAEIAKGGMGTVYLARLEGAGGFERLMAVKLMHEHLAEDDAFVTMLLDEARTAANIHHPNAVGIKDVAESPLGHYLVMDYVDGFPLSHVITHPELVTRDRIRIGMRLLADAAHGLHAAHTAKNAKGEKLGIVHRDVSPQNVLVGVDGVGRIVDFGIALAASRVAASRPGSLKGKPQYMAPEQARGEACDARTDVFALGIMAWEILTYERLFFGEMDVAVLVQVMECNVPSPLERDPNLPAGLAEATMKALGRLREDRFSTAREFAVAIERAAEAAGMLASAHEVEELVGRLFHDEIEAKNAAVRVHLSRSGGEIVPLKKGELGLVSRLFERKLVHKPRAEMGTRTGVPAGPTPGSGVRERASAEVALAETATNTPAPIVGVPVLEAAPDATARMTHERRPAAPANARFGLVGGALALVGLLALAVALALVFSGGASEERADASAPSVAGPPPPLAPAAPLAEPASAGEAGAGAGATASIDDGVGARAGTPAGGSAEAAAGTAAAEAAAGTAAAEAATRGSGAEPPEPSTPTATVPPTGSARAHGRAHGVAAAGHATGETTAGPAAEHPVEAAPSSAGGTPTLEANPYH